jgi:hypothetical protein
MTWSVLRRGAFDCQVCVPDNASDAEVLKFANSANPCGTESGWSIRRKGDPALLGDPERKRCGAHFKCCHIMLDA